VNIKKENNFINENNFNFLVKEIQGIHFPWYISGIDTRTKKYKQFSHHFFSSDNLKGWNSNFINLIEPILNKINAKCLYRIKLNLINKTDKIIEHPFHTDIDSDKFTTSLFYLNTNNGYTMFENNLKIFSEKNTLVTFSSNTLHHGTSCTDQEFRLVLNMVYIK